MLGEQIIAGQLTNKECTVMHIHDTKITMIFMRPLRHPTASMTNNPPSGYHPNNPWVLSCKQQIIALSKVHNVSNTNILR